METGFWLTLWEKAKALILSRKLWAAVGATIVILTQPAIDPQAAVNAIAAIWIAYIGAVGIEDGLRGR